MTICSHPQISRTMTVLIAAMALAGCRSTPKDVAPKTCICQPIGPVPHTVKALATRILQHPFPPQGHPTAHAHLAPFTPSTHGTNRVDMLLPALRSELASSGRIHFIDPPHHGFHNEEELSADQFSGPVARVRECGARYLIEVNQTPIALIAEITDTTSGLVILRKTTPTGTRPPSP